MYVQCTLYNYIYIIPVPGEAPATAAAALEVKRLDIPIIYAATLRTCKYIKYKIWILIYL